MNTKYFLFMIVMVHALLSFGGMILFMQIEQYVEFFQRLFGGREFLGMLGASVTAFGISSIILLALEHRVLLKNKEQEKK